MPLRAAPRPPSPDMGKMQEQAAWWRNLQGPGKEIGKPPKKLNEAIKKELEAPLIKIQQAMLDGKEVPLQGHLGVKILEKLQKKPPEELTPREAAIAWSVCEEMKGENAVNAASGTVVENVGGMGDTESIYHIPDPKLRGEVQNKVNKLQSDIEIYLVGEGHRFRDRNIILGDAQKAHDVFRPRADYVKARDDIVEARNPSKHFHELSKSEQRQIRTEAQEDVLYKDASAEIEALIVESGGKVENTDIQEALGSSNPREVALAKKAQKLNEKQVDILRQKGNIRKMDKMDDFLTFLGFNPHNNAEANILTANDVVEAVIKHHGLNDTDANDLRQNPDNAIGYLNGKKDGSIPELGVFVAELYQGKLQEYSMARNATGTEKLKKIAKPELNDNGKNKVDDRHAAFALMLQQGLGLMKDPAQELVNRLGIDKSKADQLVKDAATHGILVNNAGKAPSPTEEVRVNISNIAEWGNPSMWAEAFRRGHINEADLRGQLDHHYVNQNITDTAARGKMVDAAIKDTMDNYFPIIQGPAAHPNKADRLRAGGKWNPLALALVAMAGGPTMKNEIIDDLDTVSGAEFAQEFKI